MLPLKVLIGRNSTKRVNSNLFLFQPCGQPLRVLEVGCGVGNFIFPLIQEIPDIYFYACDFSPRAVQFVKVCMRLLDSYSAETVYISVC